MSFVLLCYCRDMQYPYPTGPSLSIMSLGAALEAHGVSVEYFDGRVHGGRRFRDLMKARPLAVGFSVMGGHQIVTSLAHTRLAKRLAPAVPVIWGGFFPTMLPEAVLAAGDVDCVVRGEGEETLLEIVRALRRGDSLRGLPGTVSMGADGLVEHAPWRAPVDVSTLPFAYRGKALELVRLFAPWITGPTREKPGVELSRGCPGRCTFCYNRIGEHGSVPRVKEPEQVREEIARMRALGLSFIDVYDDTLAAGDPRAIDHALESLRAERMSWYANMRFDLLSEPLVDTMAAAGCEWLFLGIESLDDALLREIDKGVAARRIEAGVDILRARRLPVTYSLLLRLPGEPGGPQRTEREDLERVLGFAERLHERHPEAEIQIQSLVPLPGTPLWERAMRTGYVAPRTLEEWSRWDHLRIETPTLSDPALPAKVYLTSFLAYRGRRHLQGSLARHMVWPLEKLARARIERRWFGLFVEGALLSGARAAGGLLHGVRDLLPASRKRS